jgi:hypothetical protein
MMSNVLVAALEVLCGRNDGITHLVQSDHSSQLAEFALGDSTNYFKS